MLTKDDLLADELIEVILVRNHSQQGLRHKRIARTTEIRRLLLTEPGLSSNEIFRRVGGNRGPVLQEIAEARAALSN